MTTKPKCSHSFGDEPCNGEAHQRGMCKTHYARWRTGVPMNRKRWAHPSKRGEPCPSFFGQEPCPNTINHGGFCNTHYRRWNTGADMHKPLQQSNKGKVCKGFFGDEPCGRKIKAMGYCSAHYSRLTKNSIPMDAPLKTMPPRSMAKRQFKMSKSVVTVSALGQQPIPLNEFMKENEGEAWQNEFRD